MLLTKLNADAASLITVAVQPREVEANLSAYEEALLVEILVGVSASSGSLA